MVTSRTLAALLPAMLAVTMACSGTGTSSSAPSASSLPSMSPLAAGSPPPTISASPSSVLPPAGTTTSQAPTLSLVGLGDSIPGAGGQTDTPLDSYVVLVGEAASKALGRTVAVTNLATNDGVGSDGLLSRVRNDSVHRAALAAADIVTITIGTNDWQGACDWPGDDPCWARGLASVPKNLAAILDQIKDLRKGRPTAIRVTTYYDSYIGNPTNLTLVGKPSDPWPSEFHPFYRAALETFNETICGVAEAHGAICVDLAVPFNGPSHDGPATALLLADHVHPNQAGHDLIAKTIAATGFAPLERP